LILGICFFFLFILFSQGEVTDAEIELKKQPVVKFLPKAGHIFQIYFYIGYLVAEGKDYERYPNINA
jgi:hypothetical protein